MTKTNYSIGDRVEVLWEKKLYTAKVLHIHGTGVVELTYDGDNSVGLFLSETEHGLNKMKRKRSEGGRRRTRCAW